MTATSIYDQVKGCLGLLGYNGSLLQENYTFADILGPIYVVRTIPLATFAQDPPSYRNACFGVVTSNGETGIPLVSSIRSLGAPHVVEIVDDGIRRWRMTSVGNPEFLEYVSQEHITRLFETRKADWTPEKILQARYLGNDQLRAQLDFFDIGLLSLIDSQVQTKLDSLLRRTVALTMNEYRQHHPNQDMDRSGLVRLLFRLIAAKVLGDRGHPGNWLDNDPGLVIKSVEEFYFREELPALVLQDGAAQRAAWESIRGAFHFQNLSVEALAYVYENTFVSKELRKVYGIHSTPPQVAEYIVRQLPFDQVLENGGTVFEPFAGHAVFLVAAMRRLRDLIPTSMPQEARHAYFVERLSGIEKDEFAIEVGRLSLMLADYPNPDGWRLQKGDAFLDGTTDKEIEKASLVLCNPPFEDFRQGERNTYTNLRSTHKPAEILYRIIDRPKRPRSLGFVLPRAFISGTHYRELRAMVGSTYREVELVALPDRVFRHSDAESVLLIARDNSGGANTRVIAKEVRPPDRAMFLQHGSVSSVHERFEAVDTIRTTGKLWEPALSRVWDYLESYERLDDIAEVHRGIEYNINLTNNRAKLVSQYPREGFARGLASVANGFEPFVVLAPVFLATAPKLMRTNAHKLPWNKPKVIANAHRLSRGAWRIAAAPDTTGLICYHNFHGIWPKTSLPTYVIAALLNSPIANAYLSVMEQVDNRIATIEHIPVPKLDSASIRSLEYLVRYYVDLRYQSKRELFEDEADGNTSRRLLMEIDAVILQAYDLPPRLERELLDTFAGHPRPGPVTFDRYFPENFAPYIPWHIYISEDFDEARAGATVARLPVLNDPLISEALSDVEPQGQ